MQRLKTITLAPVPGVDDDIAESQQPSAGGIQALDLNGDKVTAGILAVDMARRLDITSDADDSGRVFTITGFSRNGAAQTETLAGPDSGVVTTKKDWGSGAISITVDDDATGNIKVGTSGTVSSAWVPQNRNSWNGLGIGVVIEAEGASYTVEHTFDDPFPSGVNVGGDPYLAPFPKPDLTERTEDQQGAYEEPVTAVRLTLTAFDANARVRMNLSPGGCG